jgi:hypothetical protein
VCGGAPENWEYLPAGPVRQGILLPALLSLGREQQRDRERRPLPTYCNWGGSPCRTGPAGIEQIRSSLSLTHSALSIAETGRWDSVCWCDRVKMAQQCVVICSWFWLYTDCWCGFKS